MATYGLNLTSTGRGGDLHGKTVSIEAESLTDAIAEAETTYTGMRVIRGTRLDQPPQRTEAEIEAWMDAHRGAPKRK